MGNEKQMCGLTWHQPQTVPPVPLTFHHTGVKLVVPEQSGVHGRRETKWSRPALGNTPLNQSRFTKREKLKRTLMVTL